MGRKGGGLFVPDFSTLDSYGTRVISRSSRTRYSTAPVPSWSTTTSVSGLRHKDGAVMGSRDPITGLLRATPYSRIIHVCTNPSEAFNWSEKKNTLTWLAETTSPLGWPAFVMEDGGLYNYQSGAVNVSSDIVNRAMAEAYQKLLEQKVNLAVAAAELGEVLYWLASLVRRLVQLLLLVRNAINGKSGAAAAHKAIYAVMKDPISDSSVPDGSRVTSSPSPFEGIPSNAAYAKRLLAQSRRYRRQFGRRGSTKASNAWLEYQYALMPLIYDIYGALELLKNGLRDTHLLFSVTRTISASVDPGKFAYCSYRKTMGGSVKQSARAVYTGQLVPGLLSAAAELGLLNPALVIWELVPFSFVIDWILPIGRVLESATAPMGVRFVDGYLDKVVFGKFSASYEPAAGWLGVGNMPRADFKLLAFNRGVFVTWPLVGLYMKSPFSTPHVISAAALLATLKK